MATNAQLQSTLNMLARNLKLATSESEAEKLGLDHYLSLDKHSGRYAIMGYSLKDKGRFYTLGLTAHSLTSKEMLSMLEQFCMFHDYLKYHDV